MPSLFSLIYSCLPEVDIYASCWLDASFFVMLDFYGTYLYAGDPSICPCFGLLRKFRLLTLK